MTTYAPDGSPVEAFAVLPPGPAPQLLDAVLPPSATILDLGGGAGRIAHALTANGHRVTVVDQCQPMLDHVDPALERHLADIEENDGAIYVQRLDPELVPLAVDAESEDQGVTYAMADVRHDGDRFEATMSFARDDDTWQHRYEGVVLDDDALARALEPHGLRITRVLDDQRTWVEIRTS